MSLLRILDNLITMLFPRAARWIVGCTEPGTERFIPVTCMIFILRPSAQSWVDMFPDSAHLFTVREIER